MPIRIEISMPRQNLFLSKARSKLKITVSFQKIAKTPNLEDSQSIGWR